MLFYIIVVVLAFIITLYGQICNAQLGHCNCNFNYTNGSKFESNLITIFDDLVQHTSQICFNTCVHGQSSNQIYGLLDCREDATADQCHNCSRRATAAIRRSEYRGNGDGDTIWMDLCFLRYENYTFFGKLDTYGVGIYISSNVSEPQVIGKLLCNLSTEAESGSTLYASGTAIDSLSRKIYALVQCSRDISSDDCTTCLSNTINYILASYPGSLMANCMVIYGMSHFFNSAGLPPCPAEAPANTSPKSDNTVIVSTKACNGHTYKKGSEFETNMNTVMEDLFQKTTQTGFNTSVYGHSPDQIYGLLQCRGDTTVDSAPVVHRKQLMSFEKGVGMPLAAVFGVSFASYVMKTIVSSDNWILVDCIFTIQIMSRALMSLTRLLRAYSSICQLKQYLDLNYMLPEQLQTPCRERFTVWSSAGEIYLVEIAQHVCQRQSIIFSQLLPERQELGV